MRPTSPSSSLLLLLHPLLLFLFLLCCDAEEGIQNGGSAMMADPMVEPWQNSASRLSAWLLKLRRRRRREASSAAEEIQKCIQDLSPTNDGEGGTTAKPAADDDPELAYGKCDLAADCCRMVNSDRGDQKAADACDCAKLGVKEGK